MRSRGASSGISSLPWTRRSFAKRCRTGTRWTRSGPYGSIVSRDPKAFRNTRSCMTGVQGTRRTDSSPLSRARVWSMTCWGKGRTIGLGKGRGDGGARRLVPVPATEDHYPCLLMNFLLLPRCVWNGPAVLTSPAPSAHSRRAQLGCVACRASSPWVRKLCARVCAQGPVRWRSAKLSPTAVLLQIKKYR